MTDRGVHGSMSRSMTSAYIQAPTIFVIFGATGDLARKKILPALYHLFSIGALPKRFHIVGFSRQPLSHADYQARITEALQEKGGVVASPETLKQFLACVTYQSGQFLVAEDYGGLLAHVNSIDEKWGMCTNKLYYLSVAPQLYQAIFQNMAARGLNVGCDPKGAWTRVLVEKPFGKDAHTAAELDVQLGSIFEESQIYRLDHYLAKEIMQNILAFRFSNNLFEHSWDHTAIEKVEMRIFESIGVEGRGGFYDMNGALRDVGQNHLLQMLALIAMEHPERYEADLIRQRRTEVLSQLRVLTMDEIIHRTSRKQYEGYREISGVDPGSHTETAFRVEARLDTPRWKNVPFILEAGKRMPEERKEVAVTFRHPSPCLCPVGEGHVQNRLIFTLGPEEKITIEFWSKKPGLNFEVEPRSFEFQLQSQNGAGVAEYEKLLLDAIVGDQTLFVRTDEIQAMWRFIDPIVEAWARNHVPLEMYKPSA